MGCNTIKSPRERMPNGVFEAIKANGGYTKY